MSCKQERFAAFTEAFEAVAEERLKAEDMRVVLDIDADVQLRDAGLRYLVATLSWFVFFLGYLWMLIDNKRRSWHDIASGTQLVTQVPKR